MTWCLAPPKKPCMPFARQAQFCLARGGRSGVCRRAITLSGDQRVLDGVTLIIFVVVLGVFRTEFQIFNLNIAKELNRLVFFCASKVLNQLDQKHKF